MKAKDKRMKATNELLNGITLIKMNAWEDYFYKKVKVKIILII